MKVELCRPDNQHYCVECCLLQNCLHLKRLPDDSIGCLAHEGFGEYGLPIRPLCENFTCLAALSTDRQREALNLARSLPPGEFKASQVIKLVTG